MKRAICLCLCLLALAMTAGAALADEAAVIGVHSSGQTLQRGDTVTVTVSLENCGAASTLSITPLFDDTVFSLESGGWLVTDAQTAGFISGTAYLAYPEDRAIDGDVLTFRLRVLENAPFAEASISCQVSIESTSGPVSCQVSAAAVTVVCGHSYHPWADTDDARHSRGCSICGNRESAPHDYSNDCDTSCNTCGHTRQTAHVFGEAWLWDETSHYHACTACGLRQEEQAHIPGDAATEDAPQICTVCLLELAPALGHTHQISDQWSSNSKNHWHTCAGCDIRLEEAAHSYDNACDPDCSTCGYVREITHSYGAVWEVSAQGHWHSCQVCGQTDSLLPHVPGDAPTEEAPQTCTDCGWELAPALAHAHVPIEEYRWDQLNHWLLCECGVCTEIAAHQWDEGTVTREPTAAVSGERLCTCTVCGATKTIELYLSTTPAIQIPQATGAADEEKSVIPMLLAGIGIGVAATITVLRALKKKDPAPNA